MQSDGKRGAKEKMASAVGTMLAKTRKGLDITLRRYCNLCTLIIGTDTLCRNGESTFTGGGFPRARRTLKFDRPGRA